ncbi:MAG: radical SAM protein [Anaerolineaceae bacterium]|nr:radical SAM protein [Anaerolineaceae bacterium]
MKYVFGPVPSRRLGQSLGIDPVPLKTCNWNCIYCQLGRTRPLTNERKDYFPPEEIIDQVKEALEAHKTGEIDWVTFVGSGETTLHASLGVMIRQVKALTSLPVAVITNGSLLYLPEVRQELLEADAVLPTLDAGNAILYRKINRPHPAITFNRIIDGLISFREAYYGKLWIEVMLIKGLNDTEVELKRIAAKLNRIHPDEVHILLPDRPPSEPWVKPTDEEGLLRAQAILGNIAKIVHPATGTFDLNGSEGLVDAIVGIITRHPMKEAELVETLKQFSSEDVVKTLNQLEESGKAQIVERYGIRFWSASPDFYPTDGKDLAG